MWARTTKLPDDTVLTIILIVAAVGRYGEAALAGYGLGARLEFLMIPVVFGIGAAMTAMVQLHSLSCLAGLRRLVDGVDVPTYRHCNVPL